MVIGSCVVYPVYCHSVFFYVDCAQNRDANSVCPVAQRTIKYEYTYYRTSSQRFETSSIILCIYYFWSIYNFFSCGHKHATEPSRGVLFMQAAARKKDDDDNDRNIEKTYITRNCRQHAPLRMLLWCWYTTKLSAGERTPVECIIERNHRI